MFHILLCCSLAALAGLLGGFVDAAVAALTDFSWGFVDAAVAALTDFGDLSWAGFC